MPVLTDNFDTLRSEYLAKYPSADDPLDFAIAFGEDGLRDILVESAGREIVFEEDPDLLDGATYHFV